MKRLIIALILSGTAFASWATTYYIKANATDWTAKENFFTDAGRTQPAAQAPQAGDVVAMAAGEYAIDGASASFDVVAGLDRIVTTTGVKFVFAVNEGEKELGCLIRSGSTSDDRKTTTLVKMGAGTLAFTSTASDKQICCCSFDVQAGTLKMPQNTPSDQTYGTLKVANGASVWLAANADTSTSSTFIWIDAAEGSLITNATTRKAGHMLKVDSADVESTLAGTIGGGVRIWTSGNMSLTGVNNTMTGQPVVQGNNYGALYSTEAGKCQGVVSARAFGKADGSPSSLGTATSMLAWSPGGGGFRYTGNGEDCDKGYQVYSEIEADVWDSQQKKNVPVSVFPIFLDGGPNGGLVWSGSLQPKDNGTSLKAATRRFWFVGDNANECVWSGSCSELVKDSVTYPMHIAKAGTGTWRFADNASRKHIGGTSILDGTLKFDSIAPKGTMCSLGLSTLCTVDDSRAVRDNLFTDYAFTLGGADGDPVFEYSGTKAAVCADRPLVLAGKGGHLRASAGALDFGGVSARDANTSPTLVLDGSGTANVVREVTDGAADAKVNVEKAGTGTWTLAGNQTFSGKLKVNEGRLVIDVPKTPQQKPFNWYRFTTAQIGPDASPNSTLYARKLCLFDKDGNRINRGLRFVDEAAAQASTYTLTLTNVTIGVNEVGFDSTMHGYKVTNASTGYYTLLRALFNDIWSGSDYTGVCAFYWKDSDGKLLTPDKDNPKTWIPIVMHLPEGTAPATHFDICSWQNSDACVPSRFRLEGRYDNGDWVTVYDNIQAEHSAVDIEGRTTGVYNHWVSDGKSSDKNYSPDGFAVTQTTAPEIPYYTWFRLSIAKIFNDVDHIQLRQIALFDKEGIRQNVGMEYVEGLPTAGENTVLETPEIGPGEVGFDPSVRGYVVQRNTKYDYAFLDSLFDATVQSSMWLDFYWKSSTSASLKPSVNNPASWIPIVMHLDKTSTPVTHFDILAISNNGGGTPVRYKMEGSTDGETWDPLWSNLDDANDAPTPTAYNKWMSDCTTGGSTTNMGYKTAPGYELAVHRPDPAPTEKLTRVAGVEVAKDGTLSAPGPFTLDKLVIDVTDGVGTFDGITFAATGTLNFTNVPKGKTVRIKGTFTNCTGVENLANWTVLKDGVPAKFGLTFKDGEFVLTPSGLVITIR